VVKWLNAMVFIGNPSQSYGASPAVWDYVLYLPPDTGERAPS